MISMRTVVQQQELVAAKVSKPDLHNLGHNIFKHTHTHRTTVENINYTINVYKETLYWNALYGDKSIVDYRNILSATIKDFNYAFMAYINNYCCGTTMRRETPQTVTNV